MLKKIEKILKAKKSKMGSQNSAKSLSIASQLLFKNGGF